ncbi:MAG: T9SS type A sorting domain-containing protein [candidate division Zixibacteria bacterium]|nr:T9SS type A sorting domain-containing protein [candidate division Zixibacteria bacterium]
MIYSRFNNWFSSCRRIKIKWTFAGLCFFAFYAISTATVISIPDDQPTIQEGIETGADGDTVLVQPGFYEENIIINDRQIALASMFLLTSDTTHISSTIIDGGSAGSVITIMNSEDSTTSLIGFTIQNGLNINGGGIFCDFSNPLISNNRVIANHFDARDQEGRGAGIYCYWSNPKIMNNEIRENTNLGFTHNYAGGIYCENSNPLIKNNKILDNSSQNVGGGICLISSNAIISGNMISGNFSRYGGGISCGTYSNPIISFNVISDNNAGGTGDGLDIWYYSSPVIINNTIINNDQLGIFWSESNPLIMNSIIWDNLVFGSGSPIFAYCDIQGGYEGEGNIESEPLMRDPENGDFHLMSQYCGDTYDSPCIDAGHPDSLDILVDCLWGQGTNRADMGAYGGGAVLPLDITRQESDIPANFTLFPNYPNPFNASTTISYSLPSSSEVTLDIYDILGRKVQAFDKGIQLAGSHLLIWNAEGFSSGTYLYKITAGEIEQSRIMLLLK